jgi:predicted PurR-regulated permease PerM
MLDKKKMLIFFAIGFTLLSIVLFYIFRPLLNTILLGIVFTYLMYPLYKIINNKLKKPKISSFLVCIIFIVLVTIPLIIALNSLAIEMFNLGNRISNIDFQSIESLQCESDNLLCISFNKLIDGEFIDKIINDTLIQSISLTRNYIGGMLMKIPSFMINIFIIIFMMYYLMIDGKKFIRRIYSFLPIDDKHKKIIIIKLQKSMNGIIYGNILIGLIQSVLCGIAFYFFGIKAPILWAVITFILSFIPMIGASIIWFPAASYIIISSLMNSNVLGVWKGISLILYGFFIISSVDTIIRPKLVSNKAKIHPLLVLLGIIGGIAVFNVAGIIIGPLIIGLFITLFELFEIEKNYLFNLNKKEIKKLK